MAKLTNNLLLLPPQSKHLEKYTKTIGLSSFYAEDVENSTTRPTATNNNNNYDNLYGAVTRPYRYKGAKLKMISALAFFPPDEVVKSWVELLQKLQPWITNTNTITLR